MSSNFHGLIFFRNGHQLAFFRQNFRNCRSKNSFSQFIWKYLCDRFLRCQRIFAFLLGSTPVFILADINMKFYAQFLILWRSTKFKYIFLEDQEMLQVVLPLQVVYFAAKGLTASCLFGCKWSLHIVLLPVSYFRWKCPILLQMTCSK